MAWVRVSRRRNDKNPIPTSNRVDGSGMTVMIPKLLSCVCSHCRPPVSPGGFSVLKLPAEPPVQSKRLNESELASVPPMLVTVSVPP